MSLGTQEKKAGKFTKKVGVLSAWGGRQRGEQKKSRRGSLKRKYKWGKLCVFPPNAQTRGGVEGKDAGWGKELLIMGFWMEGWER